MIKLKSKELHFNEELKRKIEFICDFCNTKPTIVNGSIKNIEDINLNYIEPHRVLCITFLVYICWKFNKSPRNKRFRKFY